MAGRNDNRRGKREEEDNEFIDRLVHINRVAKTVKGGRNMSFAALVIVGDEKGRVGFGKGKAREVPEAIRKASEEAKRTMIRVPLREGRTLHHDVRGRHGAGKIMMRAAPPAPALSQAARCGPFWNVSAFRMWLVNPSARLTRITWFAPHLMA